MVFIELDYLCKDLYIYKFSHYNKISTSKKMCLIYEDNFWTECYENEIFWTIWFDEKSRLTPGTSVEY